MLLKQEEKKKLLDVCGEKSEVLPKCQCKSWFTKIHIVEDAVLSGLSQLKLIMTK